MEYLFCATAQTGQNYKADNVEEHRAGSETEERGVTERTNQEGPQRENTYWTTGGIKFKKTENKKKKMCDRVRGKL